MEILLNKMIHAEFLTKEEWRNYSKDAHEISFEETWNAELERIDYAMLLVNEQEPLAYVTLKETGEHSVYLQYGGAFPNSRGTILSYKAFAVMLDSLQKKYKKITTLVENNNWGMLKFYWSAKFLVTGLRYFKNHIYLELSFEGTKA